MRWASLDMEEMIESGLIKLGRGKVISKMDIEASPGPYPIYSSARLNDGKFGEYGHYMFDEELITWSVDGGGSFFYRPRHRFSVTNVGGTLHVLDPSKIDYKFLFYVLSHKHSRLVFDWTSKAHPSVIRRLYTEIPLPPLPEQKRIAKILDAADALRAKRRGSLAQLDTLLQSTFLDMFGDPVTNPKRWEVKPMSETCDLLTGFPFPSGKYIEAGTGISLCRGINVGLGRTSWKDRVDWPVPYDNQLSRFALREGDIVLAMDRPWIAGGLKIAVATASDLPSLLVQRVARIRAKEPVMQSLVYALIRSDLFEHHCNPTETTVPHISPKDLNSFPVIQPPLDLRQRFADIIESVDQQKARHRAHLTELDTLFASLQHRAFNGAL